MADDPRDPRFRVFRRASWAIYFVVAIGFSLLITISVVRSVASMTPGHHPSNGTLLMPSECVSAAKALWTELENQREGLARAPEVKVADAGWTRFRVDWLTRERDLESRCPQEQVKPVFGRLQALMDLYTTHATQFAGEVGPTVDALKKSLEQANPN